MTPDEENAALIGISVVGIITMCMVVVFLVGTAFI